MDWKLELVAVPVTDVDRAKDFYAEKAGFTVDHSEVQEMVDAGLITEQEAARHPLRNVVTRSLGTETMPQPDVWVFPPHPGERFVLCSDGIHDTVRDDEIAAVVGPRRQALSEACRALVELANERGGRDNSTVVIVSFGAS